MAAENTFKGMLTSLPKPGGGHFGKFYSLPALNDPRIVRNCDSFQVQKEDVEKIIDWENSSPKLVEIPFKPARGALAGFRWCSQCGRFGSHNLRRHSRRS